jgi:hypothetical protein
LKVEQQQAPTLYCAATEKMLQMDLMVSHQQLSDAKDFGVTEADEPLSQAQIQNLMEGVTLCSREAMGVIAVGKQYLKDIVSSSGASSGSAMVPFIKGSY